jgi:hypothetical protein
MSNVFRFHWGGMLLQSRIVANHENQLASKKSLIPLSEMASTEAPPVQDIAGILNKPVDWNKYFRYTIMTCRVRLKKDYELWIP